MVKQTEIGEIPKGWEIKKIEELFEIMIGTTPSTKNSGYWDNGTINWLTPTDMRKTDGQIYIGESERKITEDALKETNINLISTKFILLSITGASIGYVSIPKYPSTFNQNCMGLMRKNTATNPEFYAYYLTTKRLFLENMGGGAAYKILKRDNVASMLVPYASLKEQQKIASILSGVDALIESTQKTVEGAERLKKGLMQKLLTRGINHKKFKRVKSLFGRYEEIPASWSKRSLGELGKLSAGGTPSRNNKSYWENGTIPWVSSGEIKNKRIRRTEEKITKKGLEKSATKLFPRGTVLIAITGFGKTRGRSGILDIDAATNQSIVGIMSKKVVNEFLWYVLQDRYQILRNFAQGTQQPGLNLEILSNHKIFVSNDTNEQQKIASILTGVDAYIEKNRQYKEKLEILKKGLMQKLLTGQIRVKI